MSFGRRLVFSSFVNFKKCCLVSYPQAHCRCISTSLVALTNASKTAPVETIEDADWIPIYRFPYILHARMLSRVKLYQTVFTTALVPVGGYAYINEMISFEALQQTVCISAFACAMLYLMGNLLFRRVIGLMYVNKQMDHMKVAHLTFWGGRKDIVVPVSDVVPPLDFETNPMDIYLEFRRYSTTEKLYFSIRFGGVLEPEAFKLVFGSIIK